MEYKKIGEINNYVGQNINPLNVSEEVFEMYSVPSFDNQYPEIIKGKDIGSSKQIVKKDDILLCKINPRINRVWIVSQFTNNRTIASSEWIVIRNKDMYARYLMWYFRSDYFRTLMISNVTGMGGSLMRAQPKQVQEYLVPVMSYDNQMKIAKTLDKAQELIDKRKEQIKLLDELVKSKFIEMFGDPVNNPMGWEVKKLNHISTKIVSGNTPKGGSQVYVDGGILFLRSQNVWKNRLELDDVAYIDQKTHDKMAKSSLKNRDILMTKTGRINTENSSLGRASMYLGEDDRANINGHVYLIRLKEEIINEFVLFILTTDEYREYIRRVCVGGIDKRQINKEHLEEFPIIFPPTELQIQFVDFIKQVDKLKFEMKKSLRELEDNFNSLMQKAFKGELFN